MSRGSDTPRRRWRTIARTAARVAVSLALLGSGVGIAYAWSVTSTNAGNSVTGDTLVAATGLSTVPTFAGNGCTNIDVSWTGGPTGGGRGFRVEAQVGAGAFTTLAAAHATTTYSDATPYTNSTVTYRITPVVSGSGWSGTAGTTSVTCGVGDVTDLAVVAPCNTTELTWTAPAGANRYDIQRRVNGGAWTQVVTDQNGVNYSDTTVHPNGATVEYQVRPGTNTGIDGNWTPTVGVTGWSQFQLVSVAFGNSGTLGTVNAGDTIVMTFSKPVATSSMTATTVYTKSSNPNGRKGVYFPATSDQGNRTQGGWVNNTSLFSADAVLNGSVAWSVGDTVWTWTSTGAGPNMTGVLSGTFAMGTDTGAAVCAGDGVSPAVGTPTLSGRW